MRETNKNDNIKSGSVKTDMANSRNVETSVAIASQTGNYNVPYHLQKYTTNSKPNYISKDGNKL